MSLPAAPPESDPAVAPSMGAAAPLPDCSDAAAAAEQSAAGGDALDPAADRLPQLLALLARAGKHDFSGYQPQTLRRRIERRLRIHRLHSLGDYMALLAANAHERDLLGKELLIGVTGFFRDRAVWRRLHDEILPALIASQPDGFGFRAWVAGCSTGEEAYSLAIVFREVVAAMPDRAACTLEIFATDLSSDAIEIARRGYYPPRVARELSQPRLERFFVACDGGYRVEPAVRRMVVFAPHDIAVDPPFARLDLLSCRNLLIYLSAPVRQRLLQRFHHSLRPDGVLVLGSSETIDRPDGLFDAIDAPLYRRRPGPTADNTMQFMARSRATLTRPRGEGAVDDAHLPSHGLQAQADRLLLRDWSPPAVLLTANGDIVYINGQASRIFEPAAGKSNWNVHVMVREGLREPLSAALSEAARRQAAVEMRGLVVEEGSQRHRAELTVQPLHEPQSLRGLVLVVVKLTPMAARATARARRPTVQELAAELHTVRAENRALRDEIRALRHERVTSREELLAANEELQLAIERLGATSEELQSMNEELASSKQDLQWKNEELQALNMQLRARVADLELAHGDIHSLLESTQVAMLLLDRDLIVRRFTALAVKLVNLRESDIGRPIAHLTTLFRGADLPSAAHDVLETLEPREQPVVARDGRCYTMRVTPYRTRRHLIAGAVVVFIDTAPAAVPEASDARGAQIVESARAGVRATSGS